MTGASRSGIGEFKRVILDFRNIGSWTLKVAMVAPLTNVWARLGPPPTFNVAVMSSLAELIVLMLLFQCCHNFGRARLTRYFLVALVCFFVSTFASLALIEKFTTSAGKGSDRVVVGYQLRPEVAKVLTPEFTEWDALKSSEFDPTQVWTRTSVAVLRLLLPILWVVTFAFLAAGVGIFVISQRRRKQNVTG